MKSTSEKIREAMIKMMVVAMAIFMVGFGATPANALSDALWQSDDSEVVDLDEEDYDEADEFEDEDEEDEGEEEYDESEDEDEADEEYDDSEEEFEEDDEEYDEEADQDDYENEDIEGTEDLADEDYESRDTFEDVSDDETGEIDPSVEDEVVPDEDTTAVNPDSNADETAVGEDSDNTDSELRRIAELLRNGADEDETPAKNDIIEENDGKAEAEPNLTLNVILNDIANRQSESVENNYHNDGDTILERVVKTAALDEGKDYEFDTSTAITDSPQTGDDTDDMLRHLAELLAGSIALMITIIRAKIKRRRTAWYE